MMRRLARGILTLAALGVIAAAVFIWSGVYDIAATEQHTTPVYWVIEATMQRSVAVRSRDEVVPDLTKPERIEQGLGLYHAQCVQCHGAPGVAPQPAALGMMPVPAYLVPTAREWPAAKLQWVVKHGIKMTGMPAWKYR